MAAASKARVTFFRCNFSSSRNLDLNRKAISVSFISCSRCCSSFWPMDVNLEWAVCCAARARARFAASMGAMRLRAASLCQTNKPAANSTKKMQLRYLQHVFRCTTNAGSLECSSFVLLKPAAPLGVHGGLWDHLFVAAAACARWHYFLAARLGCGSRLGPRPLCARAVGAVVGEAGMRNTCAALMSDAVLGTPKRHAETASSLSVFFAWESRRLRQLPEKDQKR